MSKRKALVIGIDDYADCPLRNCVNDAQEIHLILDSSEYGFQVKSLLNEEATRRNILKGISELFEDNPEFAIIYFAGHGSSNDLSTYLVPIDPDEIDLGVDLDYLRRIVIKKSIPKRSILILLDCCHSGAGNVRSLNNLQSRSITNGDIEKVVHSLGSGSVLIAACQSHELAYEEPALNHGVFTFYLLEAMYGDAADHNGDITVPNLYDFVSQRFMTVTKQTPVFKGDIIGRIVLAKDLKPRDRTSIPAEEAKKIEITAENLMNEYIQSTSVDIASWDRDVYKLACSSLLPKLQWFERQSSKYPQLLASSSFKSALSTAQSKLADLGHLKEGLNTQIGAVEGKLGSGTFGTVWKIKDEKNAQLAYKVYHPIDLENRDKLSRFTRGYRAMAQLDHPHVVKVHKYTDCPIGFVMDLINGPNLRNFAYMEPDPTEILVQLLTVGETLKHAHSRGVIHRDVKPENIIMSFEEGDEGIRHRPYLTDFDLAWFSTATQFTKEGVGSLIYAAPEQLSKPQASVAHAVTTDVYSFGQLCFFFLCRRDPVPLLSDNTRALRETVKSWGLEEPAQKMLNFYELCSKQMPGDRIQDFREICDILYEVSQLITEYDHKKPIGFSSFAKQLIFSIVGLSPERKVSETEFYTKTGRYRIGVNCSDTTNNLCNLNVEIFAQSPPVVEGKTNYKEVRKMLNKKIDTVLKPYQKQITRHSGKEGVFNVTLSIRSTQLNTDGLELCRQILTRVIDCLESN